ncbi:hypothetical protein Tco_0614912 [Tanacetum coccineum]
MMLILRGENSAKRQKTSEYEAHVTGESVGQVNEKEQGQSSSRNQEQTDDYGFWTESYASDDDEILTKEVSQDIVEEVSLTINEAELKKITNEMLRQRYPEAPSLSMINQDLLYLKKGSSGPENIVLSLHKFPAIIFIDDDIEERTSRWPDYKNLNKNDIEDIYLLIMNGKVPDYAETGIKEHKMFSIIYEPMHEIIYKNSKKEKRVMSYSEIYKFCDATSNRVLEGLKSYNNGVKYGYIQRDLNEDEVGYLKMFAKEIEVRLKYHNQMRIWEMYVNGRPLGPRRERPE